ncbi:cupredoxin domain-containing protein [Methylocystis sp. S23]
MLEYRRLAFLIIGLAVAAASPSHPATAQDAPTRIAIEHYMFNPPDLSVKAGGKVEFVNNDQIPHSVVIETPNGETYRSKEQLDEGEAFGVALQTAGEAFFFCDLHPGMKGKITVTK